MSKNIKDPADFIEPLVINGLKGRVLKIPTTKKSKRSRNEILLIYGHHSSLERMFGIADSIAEHGNITMPDLPGFGGMDSYYKIGEKPTLDNMADYLATFIKLNYKNKKINIGAMSFGFIVVTRMLQKYPKLVTQVNILVSIVGFTSYKDFKLKKRTYYLFRWLSSICSTRLMAGFSQHIVLRPTFIRWTYTLMANKNPKMKDADKTERNKRIEFEISLWKCNDIRTYMDTTITMMLLDLTKNKVNLPVWHVGVDADQYFDGRRVKAGLKKVYKKVTVYKAHVPNHAPTVISDARQAYSMIPKEVRKELARAAKKS